MAPNTESDGTYCSDVEKEGYLLKSKDQKQIRRSKRLSQQHILSNFRSNGDPIKRLYEIYQMLKCGELSSKWMIGDWESLKFEVELIQKSLKGKQKGRISFIFKKINKNLQTPSLICSNELPVINQCNQNDEQVQSPNILAGMMTEILTEIPPYQPKNLPEIIVSVKPSEPSITLTQKNPLDLTKRNGEVQDTHDQILSQGISERDRQQLDKITVPIKDQVKTPTALCISKDSMIDLTEENAIETNQENIAPVIQSRTTKPKSPVHVSKWLQYLPTQQRPKFPEKTSKETASTIAPRKNTKSLKDSIVKLYRDQPTAATCTSNTIQKPSTTSCPKKPKYIKKANSPLIRPQCNENFRHKPFRNTENIISRDTDLPRITPRNIQSEGFCNVSPDFLLDEFLELSTSDMNDSGTSLTPSLKDRFRKAFGTDKLKDVFTGDEVIYSLKENHVIRLATALNVEHATLRKTIENILSNESYEDDIIQSDSSVVECSQSPPHRLFPSQRSQT